MAEYQRIQARYPGLVALSVPQIRSQKLRVDMHPNEAIEVGSLVWHADVLVTLFSTLQVEACICDTPVVNVAFDPPLPPERLYYSSYRSIEVDTNQPHNLRVRRSNATRLAHSPEQLIAEVNAYLNDPRRDEEQRRQLVAQECGPFDGQAGHRVGELLWQLATGEQDSHAKSTEKSLSGGRP